MLAIIYAGLVHHINPPSNIETIDPKTLHLTGEFSEPNLGTRVAADGQITSRIVATQFTFVPRCIVLPANRPVTLRFATPDVIQVHTVFTRTGDLLMPCHEYCGLGHSEMSATVRVVPPGDFKPDSQGGVSCDAR